MIIGPASLVDSRTTFTLPVVSHFEQAGRAGIIAAVRADTSMYIANRCLRLRNRPLGSEAARQVYSSNEFRSRGFLCEDGFPSSIFFTFTVLSYGSCGMSRGVG